MQRLLAIVLFFLLPLIAVADGKVFSTPIALTANAVIPDQRALIHFTNGTERLVIETRFTGAGTNFAWVVPLPSQPVIEPATTGLFPTLQYLFRPRLLHDVPRYYLLILAVTWLGYLFGFVRPTGRLVWLDAAACAIVAACAGVTVGDSAGIIVATGLLLVLILAVLAVRTGKETALAIAGLLLFLALLAAMLLPSLARSKAGALSESATSPEKVSILERKLVGVLDTTTIASRDPHALQTWLRENGFVVSSNSEPAIASYVKDGWVFVAARIRRDQAKAATSTPHPLSFTFKTDRPVYPMRLTGVDNGPVRVELYVFGPDRAASAHFHTDRCAQPAYPARATAGSGFSPYRSRDQPNIVHPLLRPWVDGAPVATKLTATLTPEAMREDVWLDWVPFAEKKANLYSRHGAWIYSANLGAGCLAVALVLACVFAFGDAARRPRLPRLTSAALALGVAKTLLAYLILPKTEVRLVKWPGFAMKNAQYALWTWLEDTKPGTREALSAEARRILANPTNDLDFQAWAQATHFKDLENYQVGGRLREEDSPGNFIIRETGGELEFVVFDNDGAEEISRRKLPMRGQP